MSLARELSDKPDPQFGPGNYPSAGFNVSPPAPKKEAKKRSKQRRPKKISVADINTEANHDGEPKESSPLPALPEVNPFSVSAPSPSKAAKVVEIASEDDYVDIHLITYALSISPLIHKKEMEDLNIFLSQTLDAVQFEYPHAKLPPLPKLDEANIIWHESELKMWYEKTKAFIDEKYLKTSAFHEVSILTPMDIKYQALTCSYAVETETISMTWVNKNYATGKNYQTTLHFIEFHVLLARFNGDKKQAENLACQIALAILDQGYLNSELQGHEHYLISGLTKFNNNEWQLILFKTKDKQSLAIKVDIANALNRTISEQHYGTKKNHPFALDIETLENFAFEQLQLDFEIITKGEQKVAEASLSQSPQESLIEHATRFVVNSRTALEHIQFQIRALLKQPASSSSVMSAYGADMLKVGENIGSYSQTVHEIISKSEQVLVKMFPPESVQAVEHLLQQGLEQLEDKLASFNIEDTLQSYLKELIRMGQELLASSPIQAVVIGAGKIADAVLVGGETVSQAAHELMQSPPGQAVVAGAQAMLNAAQISEEIVTDAVQDLVHSQAVTTGSQALLNVAQSSGESANHAVQSLIQSPVGQVVVSSAQVMVEAAVAGGERVNDAVQVVMQNPVGQSVTAATQMLVSATQQSGARVVQAVQGILHSPSDHAAVAREQVVPQTIFARIDRLNAGGNNPNPKPVQPAVSVRPERLASCQKSIIKLTFKTQKFGLAYLKAAIEQYIKQRSKGPEYQSFFASFFASRSMTVKIKAADKLLRFLDASQLNDRNRLEKFDDDEWSALNNGLLGSIVSLSKLDESMNQFEKVNKISIRILKPEVDVTKYQPRF